MRGWTNILVWLIVGVLPAAVARADGAKDGAAALRKPPAGSIAAQLSLKFSLVRAGSGTLAASLNHNQKEWDSLSPDQRERFRKEAYAFLQKNRNEQERLIQYYNKFITMSAEKQEAYRRRAEWLKVVVSSFTPEQRRKIEQMAPAERAGKLLERRDELVRRGELKLNEPTTQPAPQKK